MQVTTFKNNGLDLQGSCESILLGKFTLNCQQHTLYL